MFFKKRPSSDLISQFRFLPEIDSRKQKSKMVSGGFKTSIWTLVFSLALLKIPVVLQCCWEVAWKGKRSSVFLQPGRRLLNESWAGSDLFVIYAGLNDSVLLNVEKKEKLMWFAMSLQRLKEKKNIRKYWNHMDKMQLCQLSVQEWLHVFARKEGKHLALVVSLLYLELTSLYLASPFLIKNNCFLTCYKIITRFLSAARGVAAWRGSRKEGPIYFSCV